MNYPQLSRLLPKPHITWTVGQTLQWLSFIGLSSLSNKFQSLSIDGSILSHLQENDFREELGISSKIIIKKLTNWIEVGVKEYDRYLEGNTKQLIQPKSLSSQIKLVSKEDIEQGLFGKIKITEKQPQLEKRNTEHYPISKLQNTNQLIIKQAEQSQLSYQIPEAGATLGRHSSNTIPVMDQFVSRQHAQIFFDRGQYYLQDTKSASGTFVKICTKTELKDGMILEMGSNQFLIELDRSMLNIRVIQGPNVGMQFPAATEKQLTVGRKQSNDLPFPDDQHLSGIHTKFFKVHTIWYIQDFATTNGTWLRLSYEGQESSPYLLEDNTHFKLSSNLIYSCQRSREHRKTHRSNEEKCLICKKNEKNTIIIPCNHMVGCFECMSHDKSQVCQICKMLVQDVIKIFTA